MTMQMKKCEDTIKDFHPSLFKNREFVRCTYCGDLLQPGLMNIAKHWTCCSHNPVLMKAMEMKTPLIDEIKSVIKVK